MPLADSVSTVPQPTNHSPSYLLMLWYHFNKTIETFFIAAQLHFDWSRPRFFFSFFLIIIWRWNKSQWRADEFWPSYDGRYVLLRQHHTGDPQSEGELFYGCHQPQRYYAVYDTLEKWIAIFFHSPFGPRPRALWSWLNFRFISDRDLWKIRLEAEELQPTRLGFVGWAGRSNRLYAIYRNRYLTIAICFCNEWRNYFKISIWKPPFFPLVAQHFWATPGSFGLVMPPAGADGNYEVQTTTSFLRSRNKTFSVPDYPIGHIQVLFCCFVCPCVFHDFLVCTFVRFDQ